MMQPRLQHILGLFALSLLVLSLTAAASHAASPTEVLKTRVDAVIDILKGQEYKTANPDGQRKMLRSKTEGWFDMEEVAKRTLAIHWRKFSPKERQEFIDVFTELLERNYFERIKGQTYTDEKVVFLGEKIAQDKALVQSKIITSSREIPVDYSLIQQGADWKIYDVSVEGVSLVRNYRTQFQDILTNDTPAQLISQIRQRIEDARAGKSTS